MEVNVIMSYYHYQFQPNNDFERALLFITGQPEKWGMYILTNNYLEVTKYMSVRWLGHIYL